MKNLLFDVLVGAGQTLGPPQRLLADERTPVATHHRRAQQVWGVQEREHTQPHFLWKVKGLLQTNDKRKLLKLHF